MDMITEEYPAFPTDLQAQYMALMTQAEGISIVTRRFSKTVSCMRRKLMRMGANIRLDGRQAIIAGRSRLTARA